ncbi:MAG: FAD-binding oxidoreductase [Thioalkalivibrio sp.]|nr:FAD-binding oxidoreductase [Thioalkalivibrio sp.]
MPTSRNRQAARVRHTRLIEWRDRTAPLPVPGVPLLARGNGRSRGDVCLNDGGALLLTQGMDRLIAFDRGTGILDCEAGVLLGDLLHWCVPQGWMLPVVPLRISMGEHMDLFAATVGGLGLTGLITRVRLQMIPISSDLILTESTRLGHLDAFWEINDRLGAEWPYAMARIDCMARGPRLGRGVFVAGRHAPPQPAGTRLPRWRDHSRSLLFDMPSTLINRHTVRAFNAVYCRAAPFPGRRLQHVQRHLFPLDRLRDWSRIYGRRGFYPYQCVLPHASARDGIRTLLKRIAASAQGSFLAALKTFGDLPAPGILSFPRPGVTLALDFANRGPRTLRLLADLDDIVSDAGGALYPAKDVRMSVTMFRRGFPQWERFATQVDPAFSSTFWRRMNP